MGNHQIFWDSNPPVPEQGIPSVCVAIRENPLHVCMAEFWQTVQINKKLGFGQNWDFLSITFFDTVTFIQFNSIQFF